MSLRTIFLTKDKNKAITSDDVRDFIYPDLVSLNTGTYKKYVAILSQSGTDVPTATILENTLGITIAWSYSSEGVYVGTPSSGTFPAAKTTLLIGPGWASAGDKIEIGNGVSTLSLNTFNFAGAAANAILNLTTLEIRVYP